MENELVSIILIVLALGVLIALSYMVYKYHLSPIFTAIIDYFF